MAGERILALQLTADVFGLPTARPHVSETSGLGRPSTPPSGSGIHPDVETAVRAMTRISTVHDPDPLGRATYEELYRHVYRRLYPRLAPPL